MTSPTPDQESVREAEKLIFRVTQDFAKKMDWPEPDINLWDEMKSQVLQPLEMDIATALSNLRQQSDKYKEDAAHREMENFSLSSRLKLAEEALSKIQSNVDHDCEDSSEWEHKMIRIANEALAKLREGRG